MNYPGNDPDIRLNSPAYTSITPTSIDGKPANRYMAVYRTRGCEYGQCTMCDFSRHSDKRIIDKNIEEQHKKSLSKLKKENIEHFDLLTLGNFFNENEISPELREKLLSPLKKVSYLKRILVESRRGYITAEKLKEAKSYLREDQTLEFAIGYESSDPYIRNQVLRKGVPEKHLDETMQACKEAGVDFASYVLIKPHTLTEKKGIDDAVNTALHVLKKAEEHGVKARINFEPVFVTQETVLDELFKKGEYTPPKLWSIVDVIVKTAERLGVENTGGKLFVGLSDENLSSNRMTSNCGICDKYVKDAISNFNADQDVSKLKVLYHECKDEWEKQVADEGNASYSGKESKEELVA